MSSEHWQTFQKAQSFKFPDTSMPIDSAEAERQRRKQGGICSVKSLFCCLSVLVGKPASGGKRSNKRRQSQQQMDIYRNYQNDDASFGYNFDEPQMSPRVSTRLASADNFD
eukprot:39403_1